MQDTILGYLKEYGDVPLMEHGMTSVDSLILCQLAYLKFDGMVPDVKENKPSVSLTQLAEHDDYEKLYEDGFFEKDNRALFEGMLAGKRFRNTKLNCYINVIEKEWQTQFSAVTCLLEDGTIYVAFRGTDETIIGWKEDFNMAFLSPVPGQALSVKYLNIVTTRFPNAFYVGGHSKGGNLAVYSSMKCIPKVQERILKVYSMDGPGFRPEVLEEGRYDRIADRVVKLLPHSSMIGMVFEWDTRYQVVKSGSFGLAQHNPYTWKVKDGEFVMADAIYAQTLRVDSAFNEWLLAQDEEQIKNFIDTLYRLMVASETDNLIAFAADWKKSVNGMIAALKEVDEDTRKMLKSTVKKLFRYLALKQ